jgi:hypothetical protein
MANQTTPIHSGYSIINATFTGQGGSSLACWMEYKVVSQSAVNNTSTIRYYIYIANIANSSGYHAWCDNFDTANRGSMTVKCDGTTIYTRTKRGYATDLIPTASNYTTQYQTAFGSAEGTRFLTVMTDNAETEAAGYGEFTITHGTDGTMTVTLSWEANCSYTSSLGTVTGSGAVVLPAIDRAAPTVTLQSGNITASGFSLTVLSSAIADRWEYNLNGGSWTQFSTTEGQSASVTLNTLDVNTTYSVQVRARKKSNHVYGTSSSTSITTLGGSVLTSVSAIQANSSSANVQFSMTVYDSSYTHTLVISKDGTDLLTFSDITGTVGTNTRTFPLSSAQRETLMNAMPTEAQATMTYTLHSYNSSSEEIGSGSVRTASVVITAASAPTFTSFTVMDYSSSTAPVTGISAVLIQNQSSARISCSAATASSGTSISKYRATIGEKTVESSTTTINFGTISDSGEVSIVVEAIDGRGFSTAVTQTLNIIPYQNVSIESWSMSRQNNVETTINMSFAGHFSSITVSGVEKNSLVSVTYRYKVSTSATYGSSTALTGTTVTGTSFDYSGSPLSLSASNAYHIELTVSDALTSSVVVVYVNKGRPLVAFRSEMVGINTNTPQAALDVDGDIHMNGYPVFGFRATLDDTTDLNDVNSQGVYAQPQSAYASPGLNYPAQKAGILEVITEPSGLILQRYTTYDLSGFYVRDNFLGTLGTWRTWKSITMS